MDRRMAAMSLAMGASVGAVIARSMGKLGSRDDPDRLTHDERERLRHAAGQGTERTPEEQKRLSDSISGNPAGSVEGQCSVGLVQKLPSAPEGTVLAKRVWLIMDGERTVVAKGTPRNRCLVRVDDEKDRKRYLTYNSKGVAENACKSSWFYTRGLGKNWDEFDLEAVAADMLLVIPPEKKADRFAEIASEVSR